MSNGCAKCDALPVNEYCGFHEPEYRSADTRYAIARLLERLVLEGYVRPERTPELMNRSHNLERGHGFITTQELENLKPKQG